MINNSKLPREALEVLTTLQENGHKSYLVGGCVRDLCLGKAPKDDEMHSIIESIGFPNRKLYF